MRPSTTLQNTVKYTVWSLGIYMILTMLAALSGVIGMMLFVVLAYLSHRFDAQHVPSMSGPHSYYNSGLTMAVIIFGLIAGVLALCAGGMYCHKRFRS